MRIRIPTRVVKLEEKHRVVSAKKNDDDTVAYTHENLGWFVHFEGSWEALFVGFQKPEGLEKGAEVDILIIPRDASVE
jgi:hypothetical protein